ncbi:DUF1992 domain-containing protein [Tropicibacter sp. R16_0]|uniref:DnaJ family domain-containing protein n=1 Tax=Tropicibacter sp. R16_0 TaxID=2821102 RepID=UPI001ADCC58A|nr:DUF1992 domain-containing protein [Tropicibacter sp. R16_0]MBO9451502.1 DUF1992 domain-containing protein [Tropicibacter sp. R16_0]
MRSFRNLIERQIKKAQAEGQLDNLPGAGKPLPDRSGEAGGDAALNTAHRIMAQAGVLPEEFKIKKELDAARAEYPTLTDPAERKAAMARLADLEMRYHMAQDARRSFMR